MNATIEPEAPLCTQVTCPNFEWCRDFADIPGLCLGDPCKDYRHARDFLIVCIACAGLGFLMDCADLVMLLRWPQAAKQKATANVASACVKLSAYMLLSACGAADFMDELVGKRCFNAEGHELAESAKDGVYLFGMALLLTSAGSLALSPLSMQWGGKLVGLPYARVN